MSAKKRKATARREQFAKVNEVYKVGYDVGYEAGYDKAVAEMKAHLQIDEDPHRGQR